jgi:hypothetical protein
VLGREIGEHELGAAARKTAQRVCSAVAALERNPSQ